MKFRKKISFYIIVLKILLGSLVCSFPQTFSSHSYVKDKNLPHTLSTDISPFTTHSLRHDINADIWNVIQEPKYETFNFPEVDCSLISKPKTDLVLDGRNKPFKCKSRSKYYPKYDALKNLKNTSSKNELLLPPEFSSAPNYRDIANFPEVEYPLSANEMWKPNYWNVQPTDYTYNNVNEDHYCLNPTLNEYFTELKPVRNFGKNFKPGTQSTFLTKSCSDSTKNLLSLKNKDSIDNVIISGSRKENTTISLNPPQVDNFHLTVSPLLFTSYPMENKSPSDFNHDVCPKDLKTLDKSTKIIKTDVTSNLTSQSEILINAYVETFKDEIKTVLKTMADNIILNNLELKKEQVIPSTQSTNILEKNTKSSNLNIYDEYTSPDLLKNRRSQDLDEYTKYNKDFHIPKVDLESKLTSTDFLINSYADKFHEEMTSILKSNADNFLLHNYEKTKNKDIFPTSMNRIGLNNNNEGGPLKTQYNEHLIKDFSKISYEPQLPVTDEVINTYADKLHNEMTLKLKSIADKILLNQFESSNNKPIGEPILLDNNNKRNNKPKFTPPNNTAGLHEDKNNREITYKLKSVADDVTKDFEHPTKHIVENNKNSVYKNNPIKLDISHEKTITSTTKAPIFSDVSTHINHNDFKTNVKQDFRNDSGNKLNNKTSTSLDGLPSSAISRNDMTCKNKASVSCKSGEDIINNMDKEDGMFLPARDIEENNNQHSDSNNKDIELEEEFTTDSYPDNYGGDFSSYALSTVAPRTSTVDLIWRDSSVIEPDKSLSYPDELEQYFLLN